MIRDAEIRPCDSCGAGMVFITVGNQEGRSASLMPVNAEPDPAGNVAVYRDGTERLVGRVIGKTSVSGHETLYMPHAATCPAAARRREQATALRQAQAAHSAAQRTGRAGPRPPAGPVSYQIPPPGRPGAPCC